LDSATVRVNVVLINKKNPKHNKCVHEAELSGYFIYVSQANLLTQRTEGLNTNESATLS